MRQIQQARQLVPPRIAVQRRVAVLLVAGLLLSGTPLGCAGAAPSPTPAVPPAPTAEQTSTSSVAEPAYWPTSGWRTSTPEEQGVDSAQLLGALEQIEQARINVRTIVVIRNGYVVLEAANQPFTLDRSYGVQSVTKSVIGALVGIAIHEGYIKDVHQKVLSFFPELTIANRDANKEAITIEDLLTMQPGLDCADNKLNFAMEASKNWVQFALDLPMASPPGQKMIYCTPGPHILSAILARTTGNSTAEYARTRLFEPLGIASQDVHWQIDQQGINIGGYGLTMKPHDMAKLGLLYLYGGRWAGTQVVPQDWVSTSSAVHALGENHKDYGYLYWVYPTHFAAEGMGEQKIMVVKDRNMVVVFTAAIDWHKGAPLEKLLLDYIIPAARSDQPLPSNTSALESLQAKVGYMNNPVQPVPPLNEATRRVSGKTYYLQDNDTGWKSITMTFREGKSEVLSTVVNSGGEVSATVGLDNVYRLTDLPGEGTIAMRGSWQDERTFVVRQLQSSPDLEEVEMRLEFSGSDYNDLAIHAAEVVFGRYSFDMKGTAASPQPNPADTPSAGPTSIP